MESLIHYSSFGCFDLGFGNGLILDWMLRSLELLKAVKSGG